MPDLDTFAIVMICVGIGVVIGCLCTYCLFCCANNCSLRTAKEPRLEIRNPVSLNPMFRSSEQKEESSVNEDPIPV